MLKSDIYLNCSPSRNEAKNLEDVVKRAVQLDINTLTILDSIEKTGILSATYFHSLGPTKKQEILDLKGLREEITLLNGIEISEPYLRDEELKLYNTFPLDLIVGSINRIDTSLKEEEQIKKAYDNYYYRNLKSIIVGRIDVLSHLGSIQKYYDYSYDNYEFIDCLLKMLIKKDVALEIEPNLERKDLFCTFPSFTILRRYKELGGEKVVVASHAQSVDDIALHLEEGYQLAKELKLTPGYFSKREFKKLI